MASATFKFVPKTSATTLPSLLYKSSFYDCNPFRNKFTNFVDDFVEIAIS